MWLDDHSFLDQWLLFYMLYNPSDCGKNRVSLHKYILINDFPQEISDQLHQPPCASSHPNPSLQRLVAWRHTELVFQAEPVIA